MPTIMTKPVKNKKYAEEQRKWFAHTFGVKYGIMKTKAGYVIYRGGPRKGRKFPREPSW